LRNSALVPCEVTANYFIFTIPDSGTDFQNTGLLPASAKLAVKYGQIRWNTGYLTTQDICSRSVADTGWFGGGMRCRFAMNQCFTGPYCVNQSLSHTYIYEEISLNLD